MSMNPTTAATVQAVSTEHAPSLVRYSKPVVLSKGAIEKKGRKKEEEQEIVTNTQDILNSILPPFDYSKNGQVYREYVLSTPATKADIIGLQKELDNKLQTRQARETGICPIREELYAQCFDELIRQITIICSHRGLLLVRVRDEMRMTIQAYQTLYESALAFGMRFALKGEQNRTAWNNQISQLTDDIEELEEDVQNLENAIISIEEEDAKNREAELAKHKMEVDKVIAENRSLKEKLEKKLLDNKS
jgi:dynein light intermediate chain